MTTPTPAPPRLDIADSWALSCRFSQAGQESVCVTGWKSQDLADNMTQAKAQALLDHFWANARNLCAATVGVLGGQLRSTAGDNVVFELAAPTSSPATGAISGNSAVAAAGALIKWRTANGSRSGKGRTFFPGLPAAWVESQGRNYTPTAIAAMVDVAGNLSGNQPPGATTYRLNILSYRTGEAYLVTGGAPSTIIGLQRKRMRA